MLLRVKGTQGMVPTGQECELEVWPAVASVQASLLLELFMERLVIGEDELEMLSRVA